MNFFPLYHRAKMGSAKRTKNGDYLDRRERAMFVEMLELCCVR